MVHRKESPGYLSKYRKSEKHQPLNYGDIMIDYMTVDSINKIEAQRWQGLDGELQNVELRQLLYNSDFWTQRQKAAKWYATKGAVFVALIFINGRWDISFFNPYAYEEIKTDVIEMTAETDQLHKTNSGSHQIFFRWRIGKEGETIDATKENPQGIDIEGRVIRETFYNANEFGVKTEVVTETYVYDKKVKTVPGKIIRNNESSHPDWYRVMNILDEINLLSNGIGEEWEQVKTLWSQIGVFTNGTSPKQRLEEIKNGGNLLVDNSVNAKAMQGFGQIATDSTTLVVLLQTITTLEDKALKFAFQGRDLEGSGTNKHGMQVGLFSQAHSEYITKKKQQREKDFYRFFKDVVEPITGIQAPSRIVIWDSEYEKGKKDSLAHQGIQSKYFESQTVAQKASAEKLLADAEKSKADAEKSKADALRLQSMAKKTDKETKKLDEAPVMAKPANPIVKEQE